MGTTINNAGKPAITTSLNPAVAGAPQPTVQASDDGQVGLIGRDSWGFVDAPPAAQIKNYGEVPLQAFGDEALPTVASQQQAVLQPPDWNTPPSIKNNTFSSWGDPHETTGDGVHFNNELTGDFLAMESATGDLVVEKEQSHLNGNNNVTYNTRIGIKFNNDSIVFDATSQSLTINGQRVPLNAGFSTTTPGGVHVSYDGKTLHVTTPKGDVFNLANQGQYLDMSGNLGNRPVGSVYGELGTFGDNAASDFQLRDGFITSNTDLFLNEWKVRQGDPALW